MKRLLVFAVLVLALLAPSSSRADTTKTIYHFYSKYCPHCIEQNVFLEKLPEQYPDISILDFEVTSDPKSADLFKRFSDISGNDGLAVPAVYIGNYIVLGYDGEAGKGEQIKEILNYYNENDYRDPLEKVEAGERFGEFLPKGKENTVKFPLVGEISTKNLSLLPLTVVLGLADGFNPCAMWALVALLGLLVALNSRKKLFLVGGTFLVSSWLIYFVFLAAFLNVFYFIKFDNIIRPIVALIAIYTAWQLLSSARRESEECKVSRGKASVYRQIEKIAQESFVPLLILGAIVLAFMVNLVEFMCSVNLPVVYTNVLANANLPKLQYYLYIALYNTLYMADDIIVFFLALFSLKAFTVVNKKYARISKVIGALVILVVGILLLVYPQALSF